MPELPTARSINPTWTRLTSAITQDPADLENEQRVRVLRELLSERGAFAQWWSEQVTADIGKHEERAWLELAAQCEAAEGRTIDLEGVDLSGGGAEVVLNTGVVPVPGGTLEVSLLHRVFDGECPDVTSIRSMPAQVAVAFAPDAFHTTSKAGFTGQNPYMVQRRRDAIRALRRVNASVATAASMRRFRSGERGSTFPWSNTASALFDSVGRCWLASEIAIFGAASGHQSGYTTKRGASAFGPNSHPSELLAQARHNCNDEKWWREQRSACTDELAQSEWTFALWAKASPTVITALLPDWESTLASLPFSRQRLIQDRISRLRNWGLLAKFRSETAATTTLGRQLLTARLPTPAAPAPQQANQPMSAPAKSAQAQPAPLAQLARTEKWFQVDRVANYR